MRRRWGVWCGLVLLAVGMSAAGREAVALPLGLGFAFAGAAGAAPLHSTPQGYLGVDLRDISQAETPVLRMKDTHGAEIVLVDHDAPAGKAGLREHDVVLRMNGQTIDGKDQISRMLRECPPGRTVTLLISRDGRELTVTTQMSSHEEVERLAREQRLAVPQPQGYAPMNEATSSSAVPAVPQSAVRGGSSFIGTILMLPSYTGAILEQMSKQLAQFFGSANGEGLLVRSVAENSPAAQAGMHAGDVVVRANDQKIASTGDWTKALKSSKGRAMSVVVLREKKELTLSLTPDSKKHSMMEELIAAPQRTLDACLSWRGFAWM